MNGEKYINETSYTLVEGSQLLFSRKCERLSQTAVAVSLLEVEATWSHSYVSFENPVATVHESVTE